MTRSALVTGCNGMLGREVCAVLADTYDVTGIDIAQKGFMSPWFQRGDITDTSFIDTLFKKIKPYGGYSLCLIDEC